MHCRTDGQRAHLLCGEREGEGEDACSHESDWGNASGKGWEERRGEEREVHLPLSSMKGDRNRPCLRLAAECAKSVRRAFAN